MEEHKEEIKVKKSTIWKVLTVLFAALFLISIFTDVFRPNAKEDEQSDNDERPDNNIISIDNDPILGDKNAKVTIIEFSDYQCPYCERFHSDAFQQIKKDYIDTGKVRFVYRDFPLNFHQYAQLASEAAECADEQGKFWDMHNKLFENQAKLSKNDLKGYAKEIGLDQDKFNKCLDSREMKNEVQNDFKDGASYGVEGTPTFFINSQVLVGAQPYSAFKQVIDPMLE